MKTLEAIGVHQHSWWFFKDCPTKRSIRLPPCRAAILCFLSNDISNLQTQNLIYDRSDTFPSDHYYFIRPEIILNTSVLATLVSSNRMDSQVVITAPSASALRTATTLSFSLLEPMQSSTRTT